MRIQIKFILYKKAEGSLYKLIIIFIALYPISVRSEVSPFNLYGDKIEFDVIRDGEKVGLHTTRFLTRQNSKIIETRMGMEVTVFSIPIYSFAYEATEIWENGQMTKLDVVVLDGSDRKTIKATSITDGFSIKGPSGNFIFPGTVISTNHWNANVVNTRRVLNTLTGAINRVQITRKGIERIYLKNGNLLATRYDYSGDLNNTSAWYDNEGRWVKLQFIARDGSTISYVCNTCDF
jgi:hypothetical protein